MKDLIKAYEELINPVWIRSLIKTEARFKEWCKSGTIEDLENTLIVFEKEEMWDDCIIIRDVLQQKINENFINSLL